MSHRNNGSLTFFISSHLLCYYCPICLARMFRKGLNRVVRVGIFFLYPLSQPTGVTLVGGFSEVPLIDEGDCLLFPVYFYSLTVNEIEFCHFFTHY